MRSNPSYSTRNHRSSTSNLPNRQLGPSSYYRVCASSFCPQFHVYTQSHLGDLKQLPIKYNIKGCLQKVTTTPTADTFSEVSP